MLEVYIVEIYDIFTDSVTYWHNKLDLKGLIKAVFMLNTVMFHHINRHVQF